MSIENPTTEERLQKSLSTEDQAPVVKTETPVVEEPKFGNLSLEQWQSIAPKLKSLPVEQEAKTRSGNFYRELNYGYDKTSAFHNNVGLYLEALNPSLNLLTANPDDTYGKGFSNLNVEGRRKVLLKYREDQIRKKYPHLSKVPADEESLTVMLGAAGGYLADPTTLTPLGSGIKVASLVGGGLMASLTAAENLAEKGKIDKGEVATSAAIGTVATGAIAYGIKKLGQRIKAKQKEKATVAKMEESNRQVDVVNEQYARGTAQGLSGKELDDYVLKETQLTGDDLVEIVTTTDKKIQTDLTPDQAKILIDAADEVKAAQGDLDAARVVAPFVDNFLGIISTRIGNISKPLKLFMQKYELNVSTSRHESLKSFEPFTKSYMKVPQAEQSRVHLHIINQEFDEALKILKKYDPNASASLNASKRQFASDYKKLGLKSEELENYFPRIIKDFKGLERSMKGASRTRLDRALEQRADELKIPVTKLDDRERSKVINNIIQGKIYQSTRDKAGKVTSTWRQVRKIETVTEDMLQYYANPIQTLKQYSETTASDLAKRTFFGKHLAKIDNTDGIDLDKSIGNFLNSEMKAGKINRDQFDTLEELLTKRFGSGEQAPMTIARWMRDFGYLSVLANPLSALTQIGDVGMSVYTQGLRNTVEAMFARKGVRVDMRDFGLEGYYAQEMTDAARSAKWLEKGLKWGGFSRVDRFGKDVLLNAALQKSIKQSKTPEGIAQLSKKYKDAFGSGEFKQLVAELEKGQVTDRVKLMLWSELSGVQPISLSELPAAYLNNPNGRILYALKSYSIKQLDVMRNTIVQEYKDGNKKVAAQNLARYLAIVPLIGGTVDETKDFILGKGFNPSEIITDNAPENIFKLFGVSDFIRENYLKKGKVSGAIMATVTPPVGYIDSLGTDIQKLVTSGDILPEKTIKELPVFGKLWYYWFGGGLEKWEQWDKKND